MVCPELEYDYLKEWIEFWNNRIKLEYIRIDISRCISASNHTDNLASSCHDLLHGRVVLGYKWPTSVDHDSWEVLIDERDRSMLELSTCVSL
jgi:hypothetical protein